MKKIVIPTDFSKNAMNAIQYAITLFKYERCEFHLIHAYADEMYDHHSVVSRSVFEELKEIVGDTINEKLDALLKLIHEISPNPRHTYTAVSKFSSLIDTINDFVDIEDIDLVVMGTKGETNDCTRTFGSNTIQVLKYVACPVLAIPETYTYKAPKCILFPTNYLIPYQRRELKLLHCFSKSYRSTINFLNVSNHQKLSIRQEDNKRFIEESLPEILCKVHYVQHKNVANTIHNYISKHTVDMLVMMNSRYSFLENLLYQSTVETLGLQLDIPFLVLQNFQR